MSAFSPEYNNSAGGRQDLYAWFEKKAFFSSGKGFFQECGRDNFLEMSGLFWYDECKKSGGRVPAPGEGARGVCFCLPGVYHHHGGMGWCNVR